MTNEVIGVWHERAARKVTHYGEYAGAGHTMLTIPGDYTIYGREFTDGGMPRWYCAKIDATNIHSWFQNRIGAHYGSDNSRRDPYPCEARIQYDAFVVAQEWMQGKITLAEGWTVICCGMYSLHAGDRPMYRLVRA